MPQDFEELSGSQVSREPDFLLLGKLRRPHGVRGEIPLEVYTQMLELLAPDRVIYVGEQHLPYTIQETRWKQDLLLLKFVEINDRSLVSVLTNQMLYVKTSELPPLDDEEIYLHELIGLKVYEEDGAYLGELFEILETGANDVYLVQSDSGEEILIPAIEDVILEIDLEQERMVVARMEWYGEGEG